MHDLEWWLDHLENVRPVGDGYTALCPAHDDHQNSLSIRGIEGGVLVHCFRECNFPDIVSILEGDQTRSPNGSSTMTPKEFGETFRRRSTGDTRSLWEEYTQIPWGEWELWDVTFADGAVEFTWPELPTKKRRILSTEKKIFEWIPDGTPRPPLWPSLPNTLPERIWITEGETDCGVLRHLGYQAFALTKGAGSLQNLDRIWEPIYFRGAKSVVYVADLDESGMKSLATLASQTTAQINFFTVKLQSLVDPLLGEKDLRDLWRRIRNSSELRLALESNVESLRSFDAPNRVSLRELLETPMPALQWLVESILLKKTTSLIVGYPKIGKSWLSLDMGLSVASGSPFLGRFPAFREGSVLYIAKEDPDFALQDRLGKILVGKGLGGSVTHQAGVVRIRLPSKRDYPFFVDLSRSFLFSEDRIEELLEWLRHKMLEIGDISLVIFDPILRMIGENTDEYKATDVNRAIFDPAGKIVNEFGASTVLVHHRTKGGITGKASYGSIAFHAFSDSTVYIQGESPDKEGWVHVTTEFKSAAEGRWKYRFLELDRNYHVEVADTTEDKRVSDLVRDDLLIFLAKRSQGTLVADIDKRFADVDISVIRSLLKELEAEALVYREKEPTKAAGSKGGPRRDLWFVSLGTDDA